MKKTTSILAIELCDDCGKYYVEVPDCPGLKIKSESLWQPIAYKAIEAAINQWFLTRTIPIQPTQTVVTNSAGNTIRKIHMVTITNST